MKNDAASCIYLSRKTEYSFMLMKEKLSPRIWCAKLTANSLSFWLLWEVGSKKVSLSPRLAQSRRSVKELGHRAYETWSHCFPILHVAHLARLLPRCLEPLLRSMFSDFFVERVYVFSSLGSWSLCKLRDVPEHAVRQLWSYLILFLGGVGGV